MPARISGGMNFALPNICRHAAMSLRSIATPKSATTNRKCVGSAAPPEAAASAAPSLAGNTSTLSGEMSR